MILTNPTFYRRGEIAEAEPAVPGWTMAVDDLFPDEVLLNKLLAAHTMPRQI